jgi:hypothetical protein
MHDERPGLSVISNTLCCAKAVKYGDEQNRYRSYRNGAQ